MNKLELVRKEIDSVLMKQPDEKVRRDGFVHLYGVAQYCSLLAVKRKLDVELCTITGLLHDIYTYKFEYVKDHARLGAIEAGSLLQGMGIFELNEIEIIKTAIGNHSDKKTKHDKYSELLKDADVLQNSFYNISFEIKHRKRLKKVMKSLGIKMKIKKINKEMIGFENERL